MAKSKPQRRPFSFYRRKVELPHAGELTSPCVVMRATAIPDGDTGWDLKGDVVAQPWCRIDYLRGVIRDSGGNDDEDDPTHVVYARKNSAWTPERDMLIVYGTTVLRIMAAEQVHPRVAFWRIACVELGDVTPFNIDDLRTPENPHDPDNPQDEPPSGHDGFPLWR